MRLISSLSLALFGVSIAITTNGMVQGELLMAATGSLLIGASAVLYETFRD